MLIDEPDWLIPAKQHIELELQPFEELLFLRKF